MAHSPTSMNSLLWRAIVVSLDNPEGAGIDPNFNHGHDSFLDGWLANIEVQCFGDGFPKSVSLPASTKELYRATVSSSARAAIG